MSRERGPAVRRPRLLPGPAVLLAAAVVGVGISVYLTTVHYAGAPLVCSVGGLVDCAAVTTSRYSTVPGTDLPVTVPGIVWFVVSGAFAVVAMRPGGAEPAWLRPAHAIWAVLGVGTVLYLVWAETRLHRLCEWCTAVHVLVALSLLIALRRLQTAGLDRSFEADEV